MSNCLFAALVIKVKNPEVIIHKRGSWLEIFLRRWPHFYWEYKGRYYHYSQKDQLSWLEALWYDGVIMEFKGITNE